MPDQLTPPAKIARVLEREFTTFFRQMLKPEPGWSGVSDQQFVSALAASVIAVSSDQGLGLAKLQLLTTEIQDHINRKLQG